MRRKLYSWAFTACVAAPLSLIACGDDDDTPGGSAGRAGSGAEAGEDSAAGRAGGGAANNGGRAGSPNQAGTTSTDAGQGGTDAMGGTGGAEPTDSAGMGGMGAVGGMEGGTGGVGTDPPLTCDLSGEGKDREELPAEIEQDLELSSDKVWVIRETVKVRDGATLKIPECTRLEGLADGFIAVLRGGRIEAQGSAEAPILFTSSQPVGERAPGDWGGLVLLGRAPITYAGGATEAVYEGLTEADYTYGGNVDDDDSGVLSYVRIEYGGWEIFPDKEVNGLSMAGVGSGTTIDHVMVSNTLDDCFEWWGGSVRATYLIANNCGDDYFDGDEGFQGGGEYWFGRRSPDAVDSDDPNGFEVDSIVAGTEPRTAFSFSNVTLCGTGEPSGRPNAQYGMVLRELVTGEIDNLALLGFEYGIDTRDAFAAGDVAITNSKMWDLVEGLNQTNEPDEDSGFDDATVFTGGENNELDPDPAPFTLDECLAEGGPDDAVVSSELGAFPDAEAVADWKIDALWVDWSAE